MQLVQFVRHGKGTRTLLVKDKITKCSIPIAQYRPPVAYCYPIISKTVEYMYKITTYVTGVHCASIPPSRFLSLSLSHHPCTVIVAKKTKKYKGQTSCNINNNNSNAKAHRKATNMQMCPRTEIETKSPRSFKMHLLPLPSLHPSRVAE